MKQILMSLLSGILFLTACGQTAPTTQTAPIPVDTKTSTPSLNPTNTSTSVPSETATASITPLPTIPTFTPTFDARTIVTVTPVPKAECPKANSVSVTKFATPHSNGFYEIASADDVLTYLNSGGTLAQLAKSPPFSGEIIDLTGDGVSEVVFRGLVRYDILSCKNGKYQNLLEFEPPIDAFSIELKDVLDLNNDGIPEIIFYKFSHYGDAEIYIFEWDGSKFRSLIDVGTDAFTGVVIDSVSTTADYKLSDTNANGLKEILLEDNPYFWEHISGNTLWLLIPFRNETITLSGTVKIL